MHHANFCAHCLKSLAPAKAALPDTFPSGHSLPLNERFWPKAEVHTCSECSVEVRKKSRNRKIKINQT